jgi:para-aminobenzoate synthetase component I
VSEQRTLSGKTIDLSDLMPMEVLSRLQHLDDLVFFDSAGNFPSSAGPAISVIAACAEEVIEGNLSEEGDFDRLKQTWNVRRIHGIDSGYPDGGLCGWVDYDGRFSFGVYAKMLVYFHETGEWIEKGNLSAEMREAEVMLDCHVSEFRETMSQEVFIMLVNRIREWIAAGDIYQVNLTQQFIADCHGDASLLSLYEFLRERSPAPMAGWMKRCGREILSSSPETFLKISGRHIETRPIKGTRPRFVHPDDDRRSAYELQTSTKEISELVMITDLLRNDLGQVCEFGSIRVDEMLQLETLEQVFHLVSTVRGTMKTSVDALDVIRACFPGGSITGAPKKRACEIIDELETLPRGLYCGAMGYLGFNGECQMNIVIRTLIRENDQLHYHVGAGIVADSSPEMEYEETLHKAAGIRLAVMDWQQFVQSKITQ